MHFPLGALSFFGAAIFNLIGTLFVVTSFRLRRKVDLVLGWLVLFLAQIVVETLIVGAGIRLLSPGSLLAGAVVISFAEVYCVTENQERSRRVIGELKLGLRALLQSTLRIWRHPFLVLVGLLVLTELAWQVTLAVTLPPTSFDTLSYHLISSATWIEQHRIVHTDQSIFADTYPADQETITAWVGTFFHSLRYSDLSNLPFILMGALSVMTLARELKASKTASVFAAFIFISLPTIFLQSSTSYVDIAAGVTSVAALYFAFVAFKGYEGGRESPVVVGGYLFLAGCSAGLAAGIKSDNLVIAGLVGLIGLWQYVRAARAGMRIRFSFSFLQLAVPMAAIGAFWYVRTWITWKNPFYPLSLFGFHGYGTVQTLIIGSTLPASIAHGWGGILGQVALSWFYDAHRHSYTYDQRPGGFGLQWLVVLLPCLVVSLFLLWRKKGKGKPATPTDSSVTGRSRDGNVKDIPRRDYVILVFVPVLGLLISSHAAWYARYSVSLMLIGCVSLSYVVTRLQNLHSKWRFLSLFVQLATLASASLTMYWAATPTSFALVTKGGSFEYAGFKQILHVVAAGDGQSMLEPWPQYQVLSRIIPNGSTLAFSGVDSPIFTYPIVGVRLSRSLLRLSGSTASSVKQEMEAAKVHYLLLGPSTTDTQLYSEVTQDIENFRPLTTGAPVGGQNVYELGSWNACGSPKFILVRSSLSANRNFLVTARLTNSCGAASDLPVQLFQGKQGFTTSTNSYRQIMSSTTDYGGYVTFNIFNAPANGEYFFRQTGGYISSKLLLPAATKPFTPEYVPLGS